jgi:quercetin dioxygenase-like cupin family protein
MRMTFSGVLAVAAVAWAAHPMEAQRGQNMVWAPRPATLTPYRAPMRPHVKLADLRAQHRQDKAWRALLVDDGHSRGEYVQDAPGTKVPPRFHPDTRQWWAVIDGQLRVEIEGQEPFVATRGSIVNVPKQTLYSMETLGDRPSLRFEVNVSNVKTLHPASAEAPAPPAVPGFNWVQAAYTRRPAAYDNGNAPHVNLHDIVKGRSRFTQNVVRDPRSEVLFIYGLEKELGPLDPKDRGHFHPESAEFWVVMTGQISYLIEGQPFFVADEGDVVYVPPATYHRARFHGDAPACRLSITEFQGNSQLVEP